MVLRLLIVSIIQQITYAIVNSEDIRERRASKIKYLQFALRSTAIK